MKRRHFLQNLLALLFWIGVWWVSALIIGNAILLPTPPAVFSSLVRLLPQGDFWRAVSLSLLRVLAGLCTGIAAGLLLGFPAARIGAFRAVVSPFFTVLRSTPVASSVMILWVIFGSGAVPTVIAALLVAPLVFSATVAGIEGVDRSLIEVTEVFAMDRRTALRVLWLPSIAAEVFPAVVTGAGMAWKAGVAAEIIAYTKNSIGRGIYDAKAAVESAEMFAWTLAVILISLGIEVLLKSLKAKGEHRYA